MRWLSRLVSAVLILALLAMATVLVRSKMPTSKVGQHFKAWALFRDGSRLSKGSPVMIAGVRVGEIAQLSLDEGFARVDLLLTDRTSIPVDSWITKKSSSAFGDSYLEIIPESAEEGAPTARRLQSGERITHVLEGSSTDAVLRSVARTMPKIDNGLDTVHDVALSGRRWVNGPLQDAVQGVDHWITEGHLAQPLESADRSLARVEDGATSAAASVARAKPDVDRTLARFDRGISNARKQMADLKQGLHDGLASARDGVDKIDPTVDQMTDVVTAINEGRGEDWKGKLGKLVNSPDLANTLEDGTESLRDGVASYNMFRTWLGMRFEYNVFSGAPRAYATAEIKARNDKFYIIEFERGPLGDVPTDQLHDVPSDPQYNRYQQITQDNRFTAQFGKAFGRYRFRGGVKESTFGLGADVLMNEGRLRFSADLFGSYQRTPRLKVAGALEVFRSVYLLAGVDDALNAPGQLNILTGNTNVPTNFSTLRYGRDYFLGATLQFTDADLATLLSVYGALIVGLL